MQRNPYLFDNAAEAETAERFASLDALYNFRTFRFLETAGIARGWHCLEVGGGSGSVAAWMVDRVGPSGYVLVTDIDPRFMEGSAYRRPAHMELRRHDIGTDPLPEQAFDLIHARLVLMHVPQRQQALARLVAALKPRGWLVIEDFDGRVIDRTIPVPDAETAALYKRVAGALVTLLEERGFEVEWGRRLYGRLEAAGLTEVGMEGHVAVSEGGSLGASLDAANFAQVRREAVANGLVTDAEIDAVLARLNAPDFALFSLVMFTAWGRRPASSASRPEHDMPAESRPNRHPEDTSMTAHEQTFSSAAFAAGKPGAEATRALASRKQAPGKEKEAAGKAHLRAFCHRLARKQANSARQRTSPMTTHDQILSATEFATGKTGASLTSWIGAVAQRVAIWIDTCAD